MGLASEPVDGRGWTSVWNPAPGGHQGSKVLRTDLYSFCMSSRQAHSHRTTSLTPQLALYAQLAASGSGGSGLKHHLHIICHPRGCVLSCNSRGT